MKDFLRTVGALLFVIWLWPVWSQAAEESRASTGVRASVSFDLDNDGRRERVVLNGESDPAISVWRGRRLLWRGLHMRWRPWKLAVADVDGDGRYEIIVGVFKATRFFPQPHNCLFIYNWDGRRATPKWLGSTLSKPFTDFAFTDLNGDGRQQELVALETRRDGKQTVAAYSWNGFGFTLDWQRGAWTSAHLIAGMDGKLAIVADGKRLALAVE